tara:strand:+ start:696 stop:896 length:201 start_codon:yes stop_codon:yes gene_type:complete
MRFISFANGYVNVDHITSIQTKNISTARECTVTLVCGTKLTETSSNDIGRAILDKAIDRDSGFKTR